MDSRRRQGFGGQAGHPVSEYGTSFLWQLMSIDTKNSGMTRRKFVAQSFSKFLENLL
jgi:hypothetical protein